MFAGEIVQPDLQQQVEIQSQDPINIESSINFEYQQDKVIAASRVSKDEFFSKMNRYERYETQRDLDVFAQKYLETVHEKLATNNETKIDRDIKVNSRRLKELLVSEVRSILKRVKL